jgi:hypothetical protein
MSTCASRALSALMDVRVEMPRCARCSRGAMGQKVVYNRVKCVNKPKKISRLRRATECLRHTDRGQDLVEILRLHVNWGPLTRARACEICYVMSRAWQPRSESGNGTGHARRTTPVYVHRMRTVRPSSHRPNRLGCRIRYDGYLVWGLALRDLIPCVSDGEHHEVEDRVAPRLLKHKRERLAH